MFLPVNITEVTISVPSEDADGNVSCTETQGYQFDEYRINRAEELPAEAMEALASAFQISTQALKILGVV